MAPTSEEGTGHSPIGSRYYAPMSRSLGYAQDKPSIAVLGGINMDLVAVTPRLPKAGETVVGNSFLIYPGGKAADQAVALAKAGRL